MPSHVLLIPQHTEQQQLPLGFLPISGVIQYKAKVREDFKEPCILISRSFLIFETTRQNSVERFTIFRDEVVSMTAEAACYVQL